MGCCQSDQASELAEQAGTQLGNKLLEKGKQKAGQTGAKLLDRVETTFDDTMDKMINKKLLEKCDSTFDKAVDEFIDQTFKQALHKFNPPRRGQHDDEDKNDIEMDEIKGRAKYRQSVATNKLIAWGIPQLLIDTLGEEGWLDEENWDVLTKAELKGLNFGNGHIELFMKGMRKRKERKEEEKDAQSPQHIDEDPIKILLDWGIPSNLIDKMKEVGWTSPEYWDDLLEHDYELEDIGFKNGHISTFKRKFQSWKEEQDSKQTERKIQLLRKLEKPPKDQGSILKRNIDVENATDVEVKLRIIGERKYGSMESKSKSASQSKDTQSERSAADASASKNRSKTEQHDDSSYDKSTDKSLNVGASVTTAMPQLGSGSLNVGMAKTENVNITNKTDSLSEKERENQQSSSKKRSKKDAEATADSSSNVSHHQWQKVEVGFTEIMPNETIVFPVQIDDPNAVVYMTIYIPSEDRNICENVQIDANFIKIERVKYSFGTRIKWKHAIKPPKNPGGKHVQHDEDTINKNRRRSLIKIKEICKFMEERGVEDGLLEYIQYAVGAEESYDIGTQSDKKVEEDQKLEKDQMIDDIMKAVEIYNIKQIDKKNKTEEKENMDEQKEKVDVRQLIDRYIKIKNEYLNLKEKVFKEKKKRDRKRERENQKTQTWKHEDLDSDDEELDKIKKFYPVDGYSLLKRWELEQFHERMVDEGWRNPLDWIHLDDYTMRQNLGFRPGHISIFNRKFDLWVKKYNEIRKTIPARRKGKDGILIVGPGEKKVLKSNYNYQFTKVIVRTGGTLTVDPWGPSKNGRNGGVLFIICWNEVVLEKNAKIDVSGCGYWGSKRSKKCGAAPPGQKGGGSVGVSNCGAGGGGHGTDGFEGRRRKPGRVSTRDIVLPNQRSQEEEEEKADYDDESQTGTGTGGAVDSDIYRGEGGPKYGDDKISALDVNFKTDFTNYRANIINVRKHSRALGSGGGYHFEKKTAWKRLEKSLKWTYPAQSRGGTGGGAVKILCNRLWMHQGSSIEANGWFDRNGYEYSGGGAGGSVFLRVWTALWTYNENIDLQEMEVQSPRLWAKGGGMDVWEDWEQKKDENAIGIGGYGRIRIDYHDVYSLSFAKCAPSPIVGNATPEEQDLKKEEDKGNKKKN